MLMPLRAQSPPEFRLAVAALSFLPAVAAFGWMVKAGDREGRAAGALR